MDWQFKSFRAGSLVRKLQPALPTDPVEEHAELALQAVDREGTGAAGQGLPHDFVQLLPAKRAGSSGQRRSPSLLSPHMAAPQLERPNMGGEAELGQLAFGRSPAGGEHVNDSMRSQHKTQAAAEGLPWRGHATARLACLCTQKLPT